MLVLLDLNGFKAYNDGYGHAAGDRLLARLARALADERMYQNKRASRTAPTNRLADTRMNVPVR